jgi:hypothetical protein
MSLDNITNEYKNHYRVKDLRPEWVTLLTRTVNTKNVSVNDWNIAMDDIRKLASDNAAVNSFITAFGKEFNEYYKRNVKSIHYTTDSEDKISNTVLDSLTLTQGNRLKNDKVKFSVDSLETYKHGTGEEVLYCSGLNDGTKDVGFTMNFKESTYVENIQLYVRSVAASVNIKVCASADGNEYIEDNTHTLYLQSFGSSVDVYLIPVGMYVKTIKIIQPSGEGYTEGRFSICGIEMYKSNLTGVWVLTKYDGSKTTIPMVDPAEFAEKMQKYVDQASNSASKASSSEINAALSEGNAKTSETNAAISEDNAKASEGEALKAAKTSSDNLLELKNTIADSTDKTNTALKLLRLDANGLIPAQFIPHEKVVDVIRITSEDELDSLTDVNPGDIAYLVTPVYEDGVVIDTVTKSWRYYGGGGLVYPKWILQSTTYYDNALYAENAGHADNATRINGTLLRIGSIKEYNPADTEGVYIITDYSEGGTSNA